MNVPATLDARLRFVYDGGAVARFHTVRTIQVDSDARHSFGVAWIVTLLTEGRPSSELLLAALSHDLAEQTVGDVPAPAKRALGIGDTLNALEDRVLTEAGLFVPLSEEGQRTLKLADNLDGLMFCAQELRMGNKYVEEVGERYWSYIQRMNPQEGPEADVAAAVYRIFKEARA